VRGGLGGNPADTTDRVNNMLNIPVIPAFRPDPAIVAQIRAVVDRIKLEKLNQAVKAARKVA
jgi:hypothetical protein